MKHEPNTRKMKSVPMPAACVIALLVTLSACAQRPLRDDADTSPAMTQAPPAPAVQPAGPPEAEAGADASAEAPAPSDAQPPAVSSTPPVTQGRPYAFVCVPYDDRPKPPRKTVRKDTPQTAPAPPAPVTSAADQRPSNSAVISILGKKVFGRDGEDMGRVVDVLADSDGRARAAVIDFGGFLGVGNRRVAVDWRSLQIDPSNADKPVILSLSRGQVNAAPEFKESAHPEQAIVTDPSARAPAPQQ
jgi:hypothetical protein